MLLKSVKALGSFDLQADFTLISATTLWYRGAFSTYSDASKVIESENEDVPLLGKVST